jgi:uncharacterized DUF497 family protein
MLFDWDGANRAHIARHKISPQEAEQVLLNDPLDLEIQTVDDEERFTQVGATDSGRILLVVATWRNDTIRVVTAWDAQSMLKQEYLQNRIDKWRIPT